MIIMRHRACSFSMIGLVVLLVLTGAEPARSQGQQAAVDYVRLKFAPPDGTTCRREMLVTKNFVFGSEKAESEVVRAENTLVFRVTPSRISVTIKPRLSTASKRRMESMQDFARGLLATSDITINYDTAGRFLNVSGLTKASEALRDSVPKMVRPMVDRFLPMVISNFRTRWEHRFYQFTIQDFPIGKFGRAVQKMPLPSGQAINVTTEWSVRKQAEDQGKNIAQLFFGYSTSDQAVGSALRSTLRDTLIEGLRMFKHPRAKKAIEGLESEFPKIAVDKFWYTNDRYLDSSTMVTYLEIERRIMHLTIGDAQGGTKVMVQHKTGYDYDCT